MEHLGGSRYRLSTGREINASFGGYIGLSPEMRVGLGCDTHADEVTPEVVIREGMSIDPADFWTPAERAELADFMIEQWRRFGGRVDECRAFVEGVASMERCDDPGADERRTLASGPYCGTHDSFIDSEVTEARELLKRLGLSRP